MRPLILIVFTVLIFGCSNRDTKSRDLSPNIIIVLLDDMGFSDLGCFGGEIKTPNIDKLADQGLRFGNFHNCAKCTSSRISLLTGLYYRQAGNNLLNNSATIADIAGSKGYHTFATGKWHLEDNPLDRGFDQYFGHLYGSTNYFTGNGDFRLGRDTFNVPEDFYSTNYIMDYSLKYIQEAIDMNKPFLGYIAFNAPHSPLQAPKKVVEKYYTTYEKGWDKLREDRYVKMQKLGIVSSNTCLSPKPNFIPAWEDLSQERKSFEIYRMATYAACIDVVDQNIARLVAKLKDLDVFNNTLILILSDNGANPFERSEGTEYASWDSRSGYRAGNAWAWLSNTPFRWFKQNQHEGGISTPLIAHYPNISQTMNQKCNQDRGHVIDIMPTIIELIGAKYPETIRGHNVDPVQGVSLLNTFYGRKLSDREYIYQQWHTNRGLFKDEYKLVSFRANQWELYNIEKDRCEMNDIAQDNPTILNEMISLWKDVAEHTEHLQEQLFFNVPSSRYQEKWGDREGQDILHPDAYITFYDNIYPKLASDLMKTNMNSINKIEH